MSTQTDWKPTRVTQEKPDSDIWTPKPPVQRLSDVVIDNSFGYRGHGAGGILSYFAPGVPWWAWGFLFSAVVILFGATSVLLTGYLGQEWKQVQYDYGIVGVKTGTNSGFPIGLKTFYFFEGQEFFAEYETEIEAGYLQIRLHKVFAPFNERMLMSNDIQSSNNGEVSTIIKESGLYAVEFKARPLSLDRDGYDVDMTYSMSWGVR